MNVIMLTIFWKELENWWNNVSSCPVVLTLNHVIFGIYYDMKYFSGINYVLLLGKMYLCRQKMNGKSLEFSKFLKELKSRLEIEEIICKTNNKAHTFEKKWRNILELL